MTNVVDILKAIIPEIDLQAEKTLVTDGYIDSFDIVTIIDSLEEAFDISIPVESMVPENFESLDAIYSLVRSIKDGET